jgi:endonuclease/exonuclease/phosphatase family metal-dependent hydrolase
MKYFIRLLIVIISLPILIVIFSAPFNLKTEANENYSESILSKKLLTPSANEFSLKIMTYNIANARGFTTNQRERIDAVADLLIKLDVDIVGLQEVFIEKDREFLFKKLSTTELKSHSEYPAGFLGNGLVILSKYPIEESYFHRFKANNPWWKVWEGDWWAGKGIGLARIKIGENNYIDFYNVHAQAYRDNQASDDVRLEQFKVASEFINASSISTTPTFFVGDFNTQQNKPDYLFVEKNSKLLRLMTIDSDIDHITVVENKFFNFEVIDTQEISGTTMGSHPGKFYSRAPTPYEFWEMHFGLAEETALSDHPGYISTINILPTINVPVN